MTLQAGAEAQTGEVRKALGESIAAAVEPQSIAAKYGKQNHLCKAFATSLYALSLAVLLNRGEQVVVVVGLEHISSNMSLSTDRQETILLIP